MKIVIVASVFINNSGYIEENIAHTLAKLSHEVKVFSSFLQPKSFKNKKKVLLANEVIKEKNYSFEVVRLKTIVSFGSNVICSGLYRSVMEYNPDKIILVGVTDFFSLPLMNHNVSKQYPVYALLGDNTDMYKYETTLQRIKRFLLRHVKKYFYHKAILNTTKLILYTPETYRIIKNRISSEHYQLLDSKKRMSSLGFDDIIFFYDKKKRNEVRSRLNISENAIVVITATRIDKTKQVEEIVDTIKKQVAQNPTTKIHYLIVGFTNTNYSNKLKKYIINTLPHNSFECIEMVGSKELNRLFNASDIGIWLKAGASIQQAMGTGLQVLLPDNNNVNHLVNEKVNGYFIKNRSLFDTISIAIAKNNSVDREKTAIYNQRFSYSFLIKKMFDL